MHHPTDRNRTDDRPAPRCFRHHVWMASCGDCGDFHRPRVRRAKDPRPAESAGR